MEVPMPGSEYSLEMWKYLNFMNLCSKLVPVPPVISHSGRVVKVSCSQEECAGRTSPQSYTSCFRKPPIIRISRLFDLLPVSPRRSKSSLLPRRRMLLHF